MTDSNVNPDPMLCPLMPDSPWCLSDKPKSFKQIFEEKLEKKREGLRSEQKQTSPDDGYYRFLESIGMDADLLSRDVHIAAFIYQDRGTAMKVYRRVERMHKRLYGHCLYKLIDGNCLYQIVPYCRITRGYYSAVATCELEDVAVNINVRPFKDWWAVGSSCSLPRRFDWYPND